MEVYLIHKNEYLGPIPTKLVKRNPNETIIFKVIDPDWVEKLGWKRESNVEILAIPSTETLKEINPNRRRSLWQDVYVWKE